MTTEDELRDEIARYWQIRSKNISLSSGKIDKYKYLTGKEILLSNQSQMKK